MQFIFRDIEEVNCYSFISSQSDQRWINDENLQTVDRRTKSPDCCFKGSGEITQEIAVLVEVSEATISRELRRNRGKQGYRPQQAHHTACQRKRAATKAIKMTDEIIVLVNEQIRLDWSPEQVSGWLIKQHGIYLSHERIYQHIWADKRLGGDL